MTLPAEFAGPATEEGLRRKLVPRQIAMMAMGGAIGVGLFLGSTVTIRLAGPGVIVTYVFGALIALVMGYALAEMAVVHPVAGSFGVFAERYLSAWAGFVVRATYAFVQILAIGAEVTAVAIYFTFWFPGVPPWVWVVGIAAVLIAINTAQVGLFGELEYWFALIKVTAIVAFIARRPRARHRHRARAGHRISPPVRRSRRIPAERLARRLAGADARHHELHGHRRDRGDGRRSRASRNLDPARDADDGAAADPVLRARHRRDADDEPVAASWPKAAAASPAARSCGRLPRSGFRSPPAR